jgi:hypothetical protein
LEVPCAFIGLEPFPSPCRFDGAFCGVAHQVFEFGEDLFDWVKVGTAGRLAPAVDAVSDPLPDAS